MNYEIETRLTNHKGQEVDVFIFYNIKSTGYFLSYDSDFNVQFKNGDYAELDSIHCFDDENQPYLITPADESIWSESINEAIKTHFRKVA